MFIINNHYYRSCIVSVCSACGTKCPHLFLIECLIPSVYRYCLHIIWCVLQLRTSLLGCNKDYPHSNLKSSMYQLCRSHYGDCRRASHLSYMVIFHSISLPLLGYLRHSPLRWVFSQTIFCSADSSSWLPLVLCRSRPYGSPYCLRCTSYCSLANHLLCGMVVIHFPPNK